MLQVSVLGSYTSALAVYTNLAAVQAPSRDENLAVLKQRRSMRLAGRAEVAGQAPLACGWIV